MSSHNRKKHKIDPTRFELRFFKDNSAPHVEVETPNLILRPFMPEDELLFSELCMDPLVMEKFGEGVPLEPKEIQRLSEQWANRSQRGDPTSAFVVFKKADNDFVGIIVARHDLEERHSGISYLMHRHHQGCGYGSEMADALFQKILPRFAMRDKSKINSTIYATARVDNPASAHILTSIGMHKTGEKVKYGGLRSTFKAHLPELVNAHQNFFTKRDKSAYRSIANDKDNEVSVTLDEMLDSPFGRFMR